MIRRLRGLAAVLTILLVVLGVPLILLRVGASPIPETMPGAGEIWDALRRPDDGTLALTGFTLAAWASWVVMTFSILTELVARARGVHAPAVPGLAWPQHLARQLVGAATLLVLTVPAAAASAAPAARRYGGRLVDDHHRPGGRDRNPATSRRPCGGRGTAAGDPAPDGLPHPAWRHPVGDRPTPLG